MQTIRQELVVHIAAQELAKTCWVFMNNGKKWINMWGSYIPAETSRLSSLEEGLVQGIIYAASRVRQIRKKQVKDDGKDQHFILGICKSHVIQKLEIIEAEWPQQFACFMCFEFSGFVPITPGNTRDTYGAFKFRELPMSIFDGSFKFCHAHKMLPSLDNPDPKHPNYWLTKIERCRKSIADAQSQKKQ